MQELEKNLGYKFKCLRYLTQALTHSSHTSDIHQNYERLEFLGDRILGVTIADMLCQTFPDEPEGALAQRFVGLVCKETVAEVVKKLGVMSYIKGAPDVQRRINVLCDVGEAIIAAIYLDSGDMHVAQDFIRRNWASLVDSHSLPTKDYKTSLQERAAVLKLEAPIYKFISQTGPQHAPNFLMCVTIGDAYSMDGVGTTKKQAEQEAARKLLEKLESL